MRNVSRVYRRTIPMVIFSNHGYLLNPGLTRIDWPKQVGVVVEISNILEFNLYVLLM